MPPTRWAELASLAAQLAHAGEQIDWGAGALLAERLALLRHELDHPGDQAPSTPSAADLPVLEKALADLDAALRRARSYRDSLALDIRALARTRSGLQAYAHRE